MPLANGSTGGGHTFRGRFLLGWDRGTAIAHRGQQIFCCHGSPKLELGCTKHVRIATENRLTRCAAEVAKLFLRQLDTVYLHCTDKIVFARARARPPEHCHRAQIPRRRRCRRARAAAAAAASSAIVMCQSPFLRLFIRHGRCDKVDF